jgi:hypothetical protein
MYMDFLEKFQVAMLQSRLVVGIAPQLNRMPAPITRYDDPFLPFGRAVIEATAEFACAFSFDLASYMLLGGAGMVALERSIPAVPSDLPIILHGPFVTPDFAKAAFESPFSVDAVTLATGSLEVLRAYTSDKEHGVFANTKAAMSPAGGYVGFYHHRGFELRGQPMLWVTDEIIYAAGGMDYEKHIHAAAQQFRADSLRLEPISYDD